MRLDRRLLSLAVKELRGPVALVATVGLLVVACWVAQALLLANGLLLIFRREPLSALAPLLAALMAVAVLRSFLLWLREIAAQHAGLIIKSRLRDRLIGHLVELGPAYTVGSRTGNLQAIVVDGVEGLEGYYARYLPQLIVALLGPLGILGYLVTVDPLVAAVIGVFVVAVPLAPRMWDRRLADRARSHWGRYRELKSDYVDGMQGMTTLKSLNAAGRYRTALHARAWELFRSTMRQLAMSLVGTGLTALMIAVGKAAAIATAVVGVAGGRLDVAGVLTVLLLGAECYRPFADLSTYWHLSYVGFSAAEGISTLLAARPLPSPEVGRHPAGTTVELRGITFGYPGADSDVLVDLDLRVASGATVALLGESGAGKSTVLNLLLRFYDPRHGSVLIGGVDLREVDPVLLRRTIALVPQDIYLFHGTVVDNIRMGRPHATDAEVRAAAEAANAAEFIDRLPDGYYSQVDERGLTLSGGERQRLAIARAFLCDAPILVLDEPTSSLDAASEAVVHEALARLMRDRTTILITHRVASARMADRIMVLRGGRIVEAGSHTELWNRRGDYQRMLAVQGGGR